jgi:hypothetical protein
VTVVGAHLVVVYRLLTLFALVFGGLVMPDGAANGSTHDAVMPGDVARYTADRRALEAARRACAIRNECRAQSQCRCGCE